MAMQPDARDAALERLSAMMDGELEAGEVAGACSHWRDSAESRAGWHAYHLIGDVLRADDLACDPARDAALLRGLRARLASEPIIFAPEPLVELEQHEPARRASSAGAQRRTWNMPATAAAGVVALAGAFALGGLPNWRGSATPLASMPATQPVVVATTQGPAVEKQMPVIEKPQIVAASGKVIRDARLDRYLEAHQQFAGSSALGPSTFMRSATFNSPER